MKYFPTREHLHSNIFLFSILLVAVGLPLSRFLMSIGQIILVINWILEGNFQSKLRKFIENKSAVILCCVFLMHLIGLLYSDNIAYGLHDIQIKLPLLIFPFFIVTSNTLTTKQIDSVTAVFVSSVFISSLISLGVLFGFANIPVHDIRNISIFGSNIRLSMMVCFSIFIVLYIIYKRLSKFSKSSIVGLCILSLWLIIFLFILCSLTGIACFFILFFSIIGILIYKHILKWLAITYMLALPAIGLITFDKYIEQQKEADKDLLKNLEMKTPYGNNYAHDTLNVQRENGNRVWVYVCWKELENGWNKLSNIKFDETTKSGTPIHYIVVRYLASMGARKDYNGLNKLTAKDVEAINAGIANYNHSLTMNFINRFKQIIWDYEFYKTGTNPSGQSVIQRLIYWKTAKQIIKNNLLTGVGTGDVDDAFKKQYQASNSVLYNKWRLRTHNQFITMFVSFGLIGFLFFIFSLAYPILKLKKLNDYHYIVFFVIAILSMLPEDYFEVQTGATFYAFFNSIFLFSDYMGESKINTRQNS